MEINLGVSEKEMYPMETSKPKKNKIIYPSFRVEKELPLGLSDIGKTITVPVTLKLSSFEKRIKKEGSKYDYSFEVLNINFPVKKKTPESTEEMKSRLEE